MLRSTRTRAAVALAGSAIAAAGMVAPTSAHAGIRDGACNPGEFCYYYCYHQTGAIADFTTGLKNYGSQQPWCYEFRGGRTGSGQCVKNNARSVWNRTNRVVLVYLQSGWSGRSIAVDPGRKVDLGSLTHDNASHQFLNKPCRPPACMARH